MEKGKRERSTNFNIEETNILVNLVIKYDNVLGSKKTDAATWKEKERTWNKLSDEFNARNLTPRSVKSLKIKYEGIKKSIRKKIARNKAEQHKTGDGLPKIIAYTEYEERLLTETSINVEQIDDSNEESTSVQFNELDKQEQFNLKTLEVYETEPVLQCKRRISEEEPPFTPQKLKTNKYSTTSKDFSEVTDSRKVLISIQIENARIDQKIKQEELKFIQLKIENEKRESEERLKILLMQQKTIEESKNCTSNF